MVGRNERAEIHPKEGAAEAEPVLQIEGLGRTHAYKDVDISLTPGRTVAIVGTNGSGRESVCRAIFGAEAYDEGTLRVGGQEVRSWSMREAVRSGIAYVPSERRVEGMIGGMDAAENLTLIHPGASRRGPFLRRQRADEDRDRVVRAARRAPARPGAGPRPVLRRQPAEGRHGEVAAGRRPQGPRPRPPVAWPRPRRGRDRQRADQSHVRRAAPRCCCSPTRSRRHCTWATRSSSCATAR